MTGGLNTWIAAEVQAGVYRIDETGFRNDSKRVKVALKVILGVVLLSAVGGFGWWVWRAEQRGVFEILITGEKRPEPDSERYEVLVEELKRWRETLHDDYRKAETADQRLAVEHDARLILELVLPEMMRCWLGTGYDFNGTAEKPGEGKIACGYFVSTVIRDAGFRVNRYKLAQQPSENIMRTFLDQDDCRLRVGVDFEEYADWVEKMEPGIYLVGLDTHVGFIVNRIDGIRFFHSSGARATGVVDESRDRANALRNSRWRMLGNLSGDPGVIRMWLRGEKIRVVQ